MKDTLYEVIHSATIIVCLIVAGIIGGMVGESMRPTIYLNGEKVKARNHRIDIYINSFDLQHQIFTYAENPGEVHITTLDPITVVPQQAPVGKAVDGKAWGKGAVDLDSPDTFPPSK